MKHILGGDYEVHRDGRVINTRTENEVYGSFDNRWKYVCLKLRHNKKDHVYMKHRLVAELFVPNPKPEVYNRVHAKNGDKTDCRAENLYWGTKLPNFDPPLAAYHLDGTLDKTYVSYHEARLDGYNVTNIQHCLVGDYKTHLNRIWRWYEGDTINAKKHLKRRYTRRLKDGDRKKRPVQTTS